MAAHKSTVQHFIVSLKRYDYFVSRLMLCHHYALHYFLFGDALLTVPVANRAQRPHKSTSLYKLRDVKVLTIPVRLAPLMNSRPALIATLAPLSSW